MPQLVLQPAENDAVDTYIADASLATNNYGNDVVLNLGTQNIGKGSQTLFRAILRFDLTSLIGTQIDDATLTLTAATGNVTGDTFRVHRITQTNWTELGATWNKYDGASNWAAAGGDFDSTHADEVTINSIQNLVFTSMQSIVADAIDNRAGVLNILVKGQATTGLEYLEVESSASATPTNRPTLVVNYTLPAFHYEASGGPTVNGTSTAVLNLSYVADGGLLLAGSSDTAVEFETMPIEDALWAHLTSRESLAGVGIYPLHLPQNPKQNILPAISYNRITSGDEYDLSGPISYVHPRFNLHVWADTYNETKRIADNLKEELNNYVGFFEGTEILHVAIRNIGDMPVERSEGTNKVVYHRVMDCEIWHRTENGA